ncbi:High molecular mass early light-inducible protein HV58 chloroplastic [Bienertia sinuspersici]
MAASSLLISGFIISSTQRHSSLAQSSSSILEWHFMGKPHTRLHTHTRGHAFRMLANPNVSSGKSDFKKDILMVDPLEAKKLAAKQMAEIKTKERFEKRRRIEVINGAWAMIGLTAALVVEGRIGKGILGQLDGYWHAVLSFFIRW